MIELAVSATAVHQRSGATITVALGIIVGVLVIAYVAERFIRRGGLHPKKVPPDSPAEETGAPRPPTQVPL